MSARLKGYILALCLTNRRISSATLSFLLSATLRKALLIRRKPKAALNESLMEQLPELYIYDRKRSCSVNGYRCKNCGIRGHNIKGCPSLPENTNKEYAKRVAERMRQGLTPPHRYKAVSKDMRDFFASDNEEEEDYDDESDESDDDASDSEQEVEDEDQQVVKASTSQTNDKPKNSASSSATQTAASQYKHKNPTGRGPGRPRRSS